MNWDLSGGEGGRKKGLVEVLVNYNTGSQIFIYRPYSNSLHMLATICYQDSFWIIDVIQ